jgi:hypothetical protein
MANIKFTRPITGESWCLDIMWWVIGTRTEAERQELRAGKSSVVQANPIRPEFLPAAGDWNTRRYGLWCNDWLGNRVNA